MSTDYSRALGARLRAIRNQQGLSLQGVEDKSHGRWKAVVVGSYERGDRAVTVQRLSELAVFYGVPVSELLPDPRPSSAVTSTTKIVLNLESLGSLPADEAGPLARYASTIQAQRHDYNGKVLSIRTEDLKSLTIIDDMSPDELTTRLIEWGVLSPGMEGIVSMGGDDLLEDGELDRLVDDHGVGDVVGPEQLEDGHAQDRPVDVGQPVDRPVRRVGVDQLV